MIEQDLVSRLDKLEQENRRMRRTGRIVLAVGAMGLAMSMAAPSVCKTVWGERFVLKDGRMRERMVLDAYSTRTPTLTFKNTEGSKVAQMRLAEDGEMTMEVFQNGATADAHFQLVPSGKKSKKDKGVD